MSPETLEQGRDDAGTQSFLIVGIGASAGGLAAFEAFFSAMPADTEPGVAFVLVQHLAPDHKSMLRDLIGRYSRMEAFEIEDGMRVRPNCAYIIPPNKDLALIHGQLQLLEPTSPRGRRMPIDFFFRSMAQDLQERAVCIVLSGTGSDGTLGMRAIKEAGGMAMVQSPASAEYDGMPRSALDTGLADHELPPAEMPGPLLAYAARADRNSVDIELEPDSEPQPSVSNDGDLQKICVLLRAHTGHDFSQYKPNTLHRRIERRMAVVSSATLAQYIEYLQHTPEELDALFGDLLIGVTSFFRDAEAFAALEQLVIPKLFSGKPAGSVVRVWCSGCSSGEEAYSLAILLHEQIATLKPSYKVQIFATDIDARAIAIARNGHFPASIAADISPDRLARHFTQETDGSYRVHKRIRDMLVFSEHDVIKDPPFSKMDLISCRNLLIYMGSEIQRKLIPLFHYALNPGGFLFFGSSESIGEHADLFEVEERKHKLFRRKEHVARRAMPRFLAAAPAHEIAHAGRANTAKKTPLRDLTEQTLLQQIAPAAVLVNRQGDILYQHGRTGSYLELSPGEAGASNVLRMAREGLLGDLSSALRAADTDKQVTRRAGLRVKTNGDFTTVNLTVVPAIAHEAATPDAPLYLVILEEALESSFSAASTAASFSDVGGAEPEHRTDARVAGLIEQLRAKDVYVESTSREREAAHEALKCANEEMQSINEELQSTNEELETSKEELQSLNEELATVNSELQTKVVDLSRANNDMNNLLAGTNIGTVFVDHQLRILRFTPAATRIIRLISGDVGRPVGDIVAEFTGYDGLVRDTQAVLDTLVPREIEVHTKAGALYTMRILPYRTLENVIEGAVITFVDITKMKRAEAALRDSEDKYRSLIAQAPDAVLINHRDKIVLVNKACVRFFGTQDESDLIGRSIYDLFRDESRTALRQYMQRVRETREAVAPLDARLERADGVAVDVEVLATSFVHGSASDIHVIVREATLRKQAVAALREGELRIRQLAEVLPQLVWTGSPDGGCDYVSPQWVAFTGVPEQRQLGAGWLEQVHEEERAAVAAAWAAALRSGEPFRSALRIRHRDGGYQWFDTHVCPLRDAAGRIVKWFGASLDASIGRPS
jgi:two-component system CheB/CheR fusion protein